MADLLLHSLNEFDEIILGVIEAIQPREIVEIGSETGVFSERLKEVSRMLEAQLHIVEPFPVEQLIEDATDSDWLHLHVGLSLDVLSELRLPGEVMLIDGDHNYFTVRNELELAHSIWQENGIQGAMLLHDVGWPNARRDSYYNPLVIPPDALHPHSYERGVHIDNDEMIDGGFRGEGAFAYAEKSGGPNNGVLTAVEDFVAEHPEYVFRSVDAVFGLGALTLRETPADAIVDAAFAPYQHALVGRLERNRLELYLKVLELQDHLNGERAAHLGLQEKHKALEQQCLEQKKELQLLQQATQMRRLSSACQATKPVPSTPPPATPG